MPAWQTRQRRGLSPASTQTGDGEPVPALLSDWAGLLSGLMQAHAATAEPRFLQCSTSVAAIMVDRFFDADGGGFFDIEADADAVGHLQVREKQLPENMLAVQGLTQLYHATRNEDYRQLCEATLSAFAAVFREHGEFAAEFGLTVDLFCNPMVEVTIEGSPGDGRLPQPAGERNPPETAPTWKSRPFLRAVRPWPMCAWTPFACPR